MDTNEFLYISEYYKILLIYLIFILFLSIVSYSKKGNLFSIANILTLIFSFYSIYYLGTRGLDIGVDTKNYKNIYDNYGGEISFFLRKDFVFDYLIYFFSHNYSFQSFLLCCASVYIFGFMYGYKIIFGEYYFYPMTWFYIYPYFFQAGINTLKSGMAASVFMLCLAFYYKGFRENKIGNYIMSFMFLFLSLNIHLSMILPFFVFVFTGFFKKITIPFLFWSTALLLSMLGLQPLHYFFNIVLSYVSRFDFILIYDDVSAWRNMLLYGIPPIIFSLCFVVKYKIEGLYLRFVNSYLLLHSIYVLLIYMPFTARSAYLSEFMMPILLFYPLLMINNYDVRFVRIKISLVILGLFFIKAYSFII